jgi:hypothetical protein
MKGLENVIPNPEKRYGHIIENMIYVCELQDKNLFVFNCVFDLGDSNATNSYCGSFLDEKFDKHMSDVWGVEKFDIIIGNPPYQTSENENKKSHPIWHLFIEKSFSILCDGGYLNMVHPDSWRKIGTKFKTAQYLLKSKEMIYLECHNIRDGVKTFGVQTSYDFYCVKNINNNNFTTKIKCVNGDVEYIDISKYDFLPNGKFNEFHKLIAKDNEDKVVIINDYSYGVNIPQPHMSNNMVGDFKYPCVYTTLKDGTINVKYTNDKTRGHFGTPKVIWSNGGASTPIVDEVGEYGMTQHSYAIVDDIENLELIKRAMLNPRFMELMKYADGNSSLHRYNVKAISTFRKDFYKQFLND